MSAPVPQPVPMKIRHSTPGSTVLEVLVVGLPGAVSGKGKIHVRDLTSNNTASVDSIDVGSFSLKLNIKQPASLEAWFERDGQQSKVVPLTPRSLAQPPVLGQPKKNIINAFDGSLITISNDDGVGLPLKMDATPDMDVVVANGTTGGVVTTKTDKDGKFTVQLEASSGDLIQVLLVDPANTASTSDFVTVTAP